jgi:CheY-like chemotaxis protein
MSEHQLPLLLLVEDEHFTQEMVEAALRDSGFELAVARTGEEGILLLEETRSFRGVVTDIDLGGDISGWAVARRARELGSDYLDCLHDRRERRAVDDTWRAPKCPSDQTLRRGPDRGRHHLVAQRTSRIRRLSGMDS